MMAGPSLPLLTELTWPYVGAAVKTRLLTGVAIEPLTPTIWWLVCNDKHWHEIVTM